MDSEEKGDDSKDFGKVIDILHNKQKLSSLRTYQGDVAEFMKEKNESTISIAVKEKEREEEKIKEEEKKERFIPPAEKSVPNRKNLSANFTALVLSAVLLAGGALASFYIFEFLNRPSSNPVSVNVDIVPYNNVITLANITGKNFESELLKLSPADGISIIKISDVNGRLLTKGQDFLNFLEVPGNMTIRRMIGNDFVVGVLSQNSEKSYFIIMKVSDFGGAFAAMLDWEKTMEANLHFLNPVSSEDDPRAALAPEGHPLTASTTATTTASVKIPMKLEVWGWKDIIVKNKDTRGLVNEKNQSKIAYTFLDKNTVLITNNLSAIGEISSIYASRPVAR